MAGRQCELGHWCQSRDSQLLLRAKTSETLSSLQRQQHTVKSKMHWGSLLLTAAALARGVNSAGATLRFSCAQLVVDRLDP